MSESLELWAFVLTNAGLFVVASLLTGLSYLAFRQSGGQRSYAVAAAGFALVVFGGLVEPVFHLGSWVDYVVSREQILLIEAVETIALSTGLGCLFYAIARHGAPSSEHEAEYSTPFARESDDTTHDLFGD